MKPDYTVDKSEEYGIIELEKVEMAVNAVQYIGKIDIEKYKSVTDGKIITEQVILTENRKQHIIERRGQEFYDEYSHYFPQIISEPDFIFKDEREHTALVSKTFTKNGENINLILRLAVEGDNPNYKNSVITAIKENEKRFAQRLRNNIPISRQNHRIIQKFQNHYKMKTNDDNSAVIVYNIAEVKSNGNKIYI